MVHWNPDASESFVMIDPFESKGTLVTVGEEKLMFPLKKDAKSEELMLLSRDIVSW